MSNVTRTQNPNGTYAYSVDGTVKVEASKVLYTHASLFINPRGAVAAFYHKTAQAAAKNRGPSADFKKIGTAEIREG